MVIELKLAIIFIIIALITLKIIRTFVDDIKSEIVQGILLLIFFSSFIASVGLFITFIWNL